MTLERRYWDSDCFLGWLQAEDGKVNLCREVLNRAAAGEIEIVTSTLTIAEVLNLKGHPPIASEKRQQVVDFFKRSYIVPITITRRIAEDSRELVWDQGILPKDALHVASALRAKVDILNTFDEGLLKKSLQLGNPKLPILKPQVKQPDLPGVG